MLKIILPAFFFTHNFNIVNSGNDKVAKNGNVKSKNRKVKD